MIYAVQAVLYCLLFTGMVKYAVRGGAIDGLFFYPKPVQERAIAVGLIGRETMERNRKRFMILFVSVMAAALIGIIAGWNGVTEFRAAYLQALLFLEVMNWYDGIVIDRIWVGNSPFWVLPGCEDLPYVQTWGQVFRKRIILSGIWIIGSAAAAGIVCLLSVIF